MLDVRLRAMGIPDWLDHFRPFNVLQSWILYCFSIYVAFTSSILLGLIFALVYTLARAAIVGVGLGVTQNTHRPAPFVAAVVTATLAAFAFNVGIITHHFGFWSFGSVF